MGSRRWFLLAVVVLLVGGFALPDDAFARGGRGGGRGGRGRGGGRGGRNGDDGQPLDRKALIETVEGDMRNLDRDLRFQGGRRANFEGILRQRREEVLARHRHMGEDSRRDEDARREVSR